jgi:uncharacterized protein YecE (DUF72 family)
MANLYIGMSGFSYPEWIGEVYPHGTKREQMLGEYAKIFNAVEINMTFRRTPEPKTIDRWRDAVPEAFRFAVKAHQRITHWKKLVDAAEDVATFVRTCQGLRERLGPILFQVPPTLNFEERIVDAFGATLLPGCTYAFEYRHESFNGTAAEEVFRRHGIARCVNDDFFEPATYSVTGPFAYFRFHRDDYTGDDLENRAEMLKRIANSGVDVFAFFAHEDNPDSVKPALAMKELLG